MATMPVTALQGETLDALVWRVLGVGAGTVEEVLELNRDLAEGGAVLAEGQTIILPMSITSAIPTREIIQLWD